MKLNNETAPSFPLKGIAVGFERAEAVRSSVPSGNEAFAQIFADMNSRRDLGQLDAAANNRAARPAEVETPARKERCAAPEKKCDRNEEADAHEDDSSDVESASETEEHVSHETRHGEDKKVEKAEEKEDKKECKGEEKAQPSTQADTTPVKKEAGETAATEVVETAIADEVAAALAGEAEAAPDTTPKDAVPVLANQNKANEAKAVATPEANTQGEEGETTQKPHAEADASKHLTFRPGFANRDDQAGKTGDDNGTDSDVPADATVPVAQDVKPEHKNNLGQHIKAALAEAREEGSDAKMADVVHVAREEFKNLRAGQTPQPTENTESSSDETADTEASTQSHPAAGSRAISVADKAIGSPAPAPTGIAGGGSPSSKGEGAVNAASAAHTDHTGHLASGEKVTFAGYVKAAKDAGLAPHTSPAEQVSVQMFRMAKSGSDRFDMQLHPAELGRVDVRLEIGKDGLVRAFITADNQAAYDMLQKDSRTLERALEQAGLQTDAGSLSFNLRERQEQAQGEEGTGASGFDKLAKIKEEKELEAKKLAGVLNYSMNAQGRLDLRV